MMLILYRLSFKTFYRRFHHTNEIKNNAIIFGANEFGLLVKSIFEREEKENWNIVAFIDDKKVNIDKRIEDILVYSYMDFDELITRLSVTHLILPKKIDDKVKYILLDKSIGKKVQVLSYPDLITIKIKSPKQLFTSSTEDTIGKGIIKRLIMN
jgi:FlaA1/EpsC-like NDP-sugar epimerase